MRQMIVCALAVSMFVACQSASPGRAPDDYVITPHGLMHRSCVRQIADGERVDVQGVITRADGTRAELSPCKYPRLSLHTLQPISLVTPTVSGWVEAGDWTSATPLGSLTANWTVPSAPTTNGATIFFFPGAEPASGTTILQPVLQFGPSAGGGGNFWAAASWFCCPSGWSNYSRLINVNAGDTMLGTMTASCSGSSCNWAVTTTDQTTGASTTLNAAAVTTPFTWNFGGVLEAYGVTVCTNYPASGTTTFSNIALQDVNGNPLTPSWSNWVIGGTPSCSYSVSSSTTTVTLTY